jgi:hypothetical protein
MKKLVLTALALGLSGEAALAQSSGIPVRKDAPLPSTSSTMSTTGTGDDIMWTGNLGYTLRPGGTAVYCAPNDVQEAAKVTIKTEGAVAGMISAEQAKAVALCAVPGQISSGEMDTFENRPVYQITILPTGKQVHAKVDVDAYTGEVLNAKQFGGLRGLAGYLRESAARKKNTP